MVSGEVGSLSVGRPLRTRAEVDGDVEEEEDVQAGGDQVERVRGRAAQVGLEADLHRLGVGLGLGLGLGVGVGVGVGVELGVGVVTLALALALTLALILALALALASRPTCSGSTTVM